MISPRPPSIATAPRNLRGAMLLLIGILIVAAAAACGDGDGDDGSAAACGDTRVPQPVERPTFDAPPELSIDESVTYTATLDTSCGEIVMELDAAAAPVAVNNFIFLARKSFYDGLLFHRAVPQFVIQGGDPFGNGTGGPGYQFGDELPDDGYPLGSVAMANSGPDTNGSQFFIVSGSNGETLPNQYTKFGKVTSGIEVAIKVADEYGDGTLQAPSAPVYIHSVTIREF